MAIAAGNDLISDAPCVAVKHLFHKTKLLNTGQTFLDVRSMCWTNNKKLIYGASQVLELYIK